MITFSKAETRNGQKIMSVQATNLVLRHLGSGTQGWCLQWWHVDGYRTCEEHPGFYPLRDAKKRAAELLEKGTSEA